jgi:hypothetical protein
MKETETLAHSHHGCPVTRTATSTPGAPMFATSEIREQISRIAHGLTHDLTLRDDLKQEAMLCFWQAESQSPGQTASWY